MTEAQVLDSPWRTQQEAAAYAKCGVRTINEALRKGELRGYQSKPGTAPAAGGRAKRGGTWRINIVDLDAWIRGELASAEPDIPSIGARSRRGRSS